jgi:hypothetical protein
MREVAADRLRPATIRKQLDYGTAPDAVGLIFRAVDGLRAHVSRQAIDGIGNLGLHAAEETP